MSDRRPHAEQVSLPCRDGYRLNGHLWTPLSAPGRGMVIVNPATGVLARYYHRYAQFLAEQGLTVLTYDYRGIGASRPKRLRGCGFRWRDWGELDFEAAVTWARQRQPDGLLAVVGHSIGGFLPGLAPSAVQVDRILTVGAQYAYWRDYVVDQRLVLYLRWHVVMPALTWLCGYFPGKALGWLEDLPAGVANEWSFRGPRMEDSYPPEDRPGILARFAAVRAPILAISLTDDQYGTPAAIRRTLSYYIGSPRRELYLQPQALGFDSVGHFDPFHARHRPLFWRDSCRWLLDDGNPWPRAAVIGD